MPAERRAPRALPPRGEPTAPLAGLRVLDLSYVFATPYLGGLLADLGAEVIKVEAPHRLDQTRVSFSPFFENDDWSARVTYSWRSKYYTQVDRGNFLVTDDYDSLDANLTYKVNDFLSVSLDGMNLLDSNYYTYAEVEGIANTEKLVRGDYRTGRRYMATLRVQF